MVGGQFVDVTADPDLDEEALRDLHSLKTGRLIGASVTAPLILVGLDEERMDPYRRFAAELGVLFQIVDDILDVTGSDEALGKPQGSDERQGKPTYVSVLGLERARALAAESHGAARAALAEAEGGAGDLEQIADFILERDS
jgi:geranylgeranyl diphosphate synthase type II